MGKTVAKPSKVARLSINTKAFQLCKGSGLSTNEESIQERTIFLSKDKSCLTIKFSPRSPPGTANAEHYLRKPNTELRLEDEVRKKIM